MASIYIPSVEFDDDGFLQYRAVVECETSSRYTVDLHIVYKPISRKMSLAVHPPLGMRSIIKCDYTANPIAEYRTYDEDEDKLISWWRFRINKQVLQVDLIRDKIIGSNIHVQGVAFAVSFVQSDQT